MDKFWSLKHAALLVFLICSLSTKVDGGRDEKGKLVTVNKDECKCPKGDETDWKTGHYYYCGGQINSKQCKVEAVYSCKDKNPGDDPELVAECKGDCHLNTVTPVGYCNVVYNVPKRAIYSGDPATLKSGF